jgi:hypothetical protein
LRQVIRRRETQRGGAIDNGVIDIGAAITGERNARKCSRPNRPRATDGEKDTKRIVFKNIFDNCFGVDWNAFGLECP